MMQQFKTGLSNSRVKRIRKQGGEGLVTFDIVDEGGLGRVKRSRKQGIVNSLSKLQIGLTSFYYGLLEGKFEQKLFKQELQSLKYEGGRDKNCDRKGGASIESLRSTALGRSVSAETVRRVLRKAGYNGRVARKKPLIGENASQAAEIVNGVCGADTVTANYMQFWFRRFRSAVFDVKGAPHPGRPIIKNVDKNHRNNRS
ncbi:hypothetical protein TNCV_3784321 [Trichonephila clavipes]|nr:hypothetical protein TNCV_3784321 [Trichonephila clavipes]